MKHLNIGTIGHLGSGKTTLTAAITNVLAQETGGEAKSVADIDRSPEEKKRGMTISNTHVEYETANHRYSHVDCPGHVKFVKHMITGASQMDGAILVVSAPEGVMPQTREHILLAHQMGVSSIVVFLNKADLVNSNQLKRVEGDVRNQLSECGFLGNDIPIITGSALQALNGGTGKYGVQSVLDLMATVDRDISMPVRKSDKPFLMPIASVFSNTDGTVVTGVIERGSIHVGDEVEVVGLTESQRCVIDGIEAFGKTLDSGQAGDNVGCLLRGIHINKVRRGQVLSTPGSVASHTKFTADIDVLEKKDGGPTTPFFTGYSPQLHIRTADVPCTITLLKTEMVMPGDRVSLAIELDRPIVIEKGLRFVIREGGHTTVGTGVITKVLDGQSPLSTAQEKFVFLLLKRAVNLPKSKSSQSKSTKGNEPPKQKSDKNRWSLSIESNRVRFSRNDTVLFWRTNSEDFAIFAERHNVAIPLQITTLDQASQKILEEFLDDEGLTWSECFD